MRLLHTSTLQLKEFSDDEILKYAILSHRWEGREPSYQDFRNSPTHDGSRYDKVKNACALARTRGHEWIWIDTICIDKTSSAELSEAINSMYRWYANSVECYAYLSDVHPPSTTTSSSENDDGNDDQAARLHHYMAPFRASLWFTRGWTLQELLAPAAVYFADSQWRIFGNRADLARPIFEATGIPLARWRSACIAQKMSWAAKRATSRAEDRAYCLLGLFDVNMPLLYGEGGVKAFVRLQREIIGKSDDETIFAWVEPSPSPSSEPAAGEKTTPGRGLLAVRPEFFRHSGDVCIQPALAKGRMPWAMTNKGLQFEIPDNGSLPYWFSGRVGRRVELALNAWKGEQPYPVRVSLVNQGEGIWRRYNCSEWMTAGGVDTTFPSGNQSPSTKPLWVKQDGL